MLQSSTLAALGKQYELKFINPTWRRLLVAVLWLHAHAFLHQRLVVSCQGPAYRATCNHIAPQALECHR
jgi:hypothetical protein